VSFYGRSWDRYVVHSFPKAKPPGATFPGDEWGNRGWWNACYDRLLGRWGAETWTKVVEIGPGSGKYTSMVLERAPECSVIACDVSEEFLRVLRERCDEYVLAGRLQPMLLRAKEADELLAAVEARGWRGEVDAVFSIDSMVHVDLQYLAAYLVTAALVLRPDGLLSLTLADATSTLGRQKLLDEIALYYPLQGEPSLKFEYLSPDIVSSLLPALGFDLCELDYSVPEPEKQRDLFVVARKATPKPELERYLRS
jgi:cyclopropane fatty-acyl-phospholipid synthase-like methyltransferase